MYPNREFYKALSSLQIKLDELVDRKDDGWYRQFHTLHKADRNCPYLGTVSKQFSPDFLAKVMEELIRSYNELNKPTG
jgi:hypothetical protein